MVRLLPITDAAYQDYVAVSVKEYAEDHIRDGQWSPAEALEKSANELAQLLPDGVKTPNHYLFTVVDADSQPIGMVWYMVRSRPQGTDAFIYDIRMHENARGQGYGTATLKAVEEDATLRGATSISLHVFGHNEGAFRLYQRVGYRVTNINMTKELSERGDVAPS